MRYCSSCQVHIRGDRDTCPLCHTPIDINEKPSVDTPYPDFPVQPKKISAVNIINYLMLAILGIGVMTLIFQGQTQRWFFEMAFMAFSCWYALSAFLRGYYNGSQAMFCFVSTFGLALWIGEALNLFHGFAIDVVMPSFVLLIAVTMIVLYWKPLCYDEAVIIDLFGIALVGLLHFLIVAILPIKISVLTFAAGCFGVLVLLAIMVFKGRTLQNELYRRWYL